MKITTIAQLATAVRARRLELGMTKSALAERSGVSRLWIARFESGAPNAEVGRLLRVLGGLGLHLAVFPDGATAGPPPTESTVDLDALLSDYLDVPS